MTAEQSRKANSLIKQSCANYDAALNNCIALDDGTAPGCPQMLTYSLLRKYFKNAVLPAEPGLEAQEFLGHEDISTTMNIYTRCFNETKKQTSNIMNAIYTS